MAVRNAWIVFVLLWLVLEVHGDHLMSSTYKDVESHVLGTTYTHSIMEVQYDEELYLRRQWTCPCVNATIACGATAGRTAAPIDESGYTFVRMSAGVWYNDSILNDFGVRYYTFDLAYDASNPCPELTFEFQATDAGLSTYLATRAIPTPGNHAWYHPYYGFSSYTICPTHPDFVYGRYYALWQNQASSISNVYAFRVTVGSSPTCPISASPAPAVIEEPAYNAYPNAQAAQWLEDGVALFTTLPSPAPDHVYYYYKLLAPSGCTNFSVASRRHDIDTNLDLFVSVSDPNPSFDTFSDWFCTMDADDFIDIYYCNPNTSASYTIFYIGVHLFPGASGFEIVATTQHYQPPVALSAFAFAQSKYALVTGVVPELECLEDDPTNPGQQRVLETSTCKFSSYYSCDLDGYECCYRFSPIPPVASPNAMWPWNTWDTTLGQYFLQLVSVLPHPPLVPGKLAFMLYKGWTQVSANATHSRVTDLSQCTIKMSGKLQFSDYRLLPSLDLGLSKKRPLCDLNALNETRGEIEELTDLMDTATEHTSMLASLQMAISALGYDDSIIGCDNVMQSLALTKNVVEQTEVPLCAYARSTKEWFEDACCNPDLALTVACRPALLNRNVPAYYGSNYNAVKEQCANPSCTNKTVEAWTKGFAVMGVGNDICSSVFSRVASLPRILELSSFASSCRNSIEGVDLQGPTCRSDSDCLFGRICSNTTRRCLHTTDDLLQCLAESVDSQAARVLYSAWNLTGATNVTTLKDRFSSALVSDQCVGPNSISYRAHYAYQVQIANCVDDCLIRNMEPKCLDINDPSCVIPPECDGGQTPGACYRVWVPVLQDNEGCANTKMCNWYRTGFDPCPSSASSTVCDSQCVNGSLSANVCLDCTITRDGRCLELEGVASQTECYVPRCSTNASISDETECRADGVCTVDCIACVTEEVCVVSGGCTSDWEFEPIEALHIGITGICLYPSSWSFMDGYYCPGAASGDFMTRMGCANATVGTENDCPTRWIPFPQSASECTDLPGYGCYVESLDRWLPRNQSECLVCEDCEWKPFYVWHIGEWVSGVLKYAVWEPRNYSVQSRVAPAVSYPQLATFLETAVAKVVAPAFITEALCRFGSPLPLEVSATCDCVQSDTALTEYGSSACFSNVHAEIGFGTACPYLASSLETEVATIFVHNNSLVGTTRSVAQCQKLGVETSPASLFELPANALSVTQSLIQGSSKNAYWVVQNELNATVGQILSPGVQLSFDFEWLNPIHLCIKIDSSIKEATFSKGKKAIYTLAILDESDNRIKVANMEPILSSAQRLYASDFSALSSHFVDSTSPSASSSASGTTSYVCAEVKETGTYFAAAVVPGYTKLRTRVSSSQYYLGAAIYGLVIVFGVTQFVMLALDSSKQVILYLKYGFIVVILLNCIVRMVYVLLPANAFGKSMDSIQFIVFELPTFLYFSVFSIIAYLWAVVVLKTYYFGKKHLAALREQQLRLGILMANCFMFFVFIVFIFLIAILPERERASPCFLGTLAGTNSSATYKIKLAYWIFQFVVSICLSVGFLGAAVALIRLVLKIREAQAKGAAKSGMATTSKTARRRRAQQVAYWTQLWIITVVALVCIVFLLIRSAIFLWAAATGNTLNVIVFVLLECIPQAMVLFYVHPFRCFREEGRRSSSSTRYTGAGSSMARTRDGHSTQAGSYASHESNDAAAMSTFSVGSSYEPGSYSTEAVM